MELDARNMEQVEIYRLLREAMSSCRLHNDDCINILISDKDLINRVKSFAAMSGYQAVHEEKEGYQLLHLTGGACGCGG
ncbi:MAG: hypothetical protein ACYC69_10950 [Thermodesulfovibrionales bacterium]